MDKSPEEACCFRNELICWAIPLLRERFEVFLSHLMLPSIWEATGGRAVREESIRRI